MYSFNYERKEGGVESIGSERETSDAIGGYVRPHSSWSNMKHRYVERFQFHEQNLADIVNSSLRSAVQAIPRSWADEVQYYPCKKKRLQQSTAYISPTIEPMLTMVPERRFAMKGTTALQTRRMANVLVSNVCWILSMLCSTKGPIVKNERKIRN
jgi:hypothetical protein